jgi:hypothetical protein
MKSTVQKLSPKEREALALFHDSEADKALRKLVDTERLELAKDHVDQSDILMIRYLSGGANSLKRLIVTLDEIYKQNG